MSDQPNDGRNDFNFLFGNWNAHHRRLRARLEGSDSWEEFDSCMTVLPILNGLGNVDYITMHREIGTRYGATVRLFSPETRQWKIYWADGISGTLYEPMIGAFQDGIGKFYDREIHGQQTIFSRFIWTPLTADTCRWEQALSPDAGITWETNWIMDFDRQK